VSIGNSLEFSPGHRGWIRPSHSRQSGMSKAARPIKSGKAQKKSRLLEALNRAPDAVKAHDRALEIGSPMQLYQFARRLQIQEKKQDEAMAVFRVIVKRAPDGLVGHLSQGRLYSAAGNFDGAAKEVKTAQAIPGNSDQQVKALDPLIKRLENKEDINQ